MSNIYNDWSSASTREDEGDILIKYIPSSYSPNFYSLNNILDLNDNVDISYIRTNEIDVSSIDTDKIVGITGYIRDLTVDSIISNSFIIKDDVGVDKNFIVGENLNVLEDTDLSGNLKVCGITDMINDVNIHKSLNIGDDLRIRGDVDIIGDISANNSFFNNIKTSGLIIEKEDDEYINRIQVDTDELYVWVNNTQPNLRLDDISFNVLVFRRTANSGYSDNYLLIKEIQLIINDVNILNDNVTYLTDTRNSLFENQESAFYYWDSKRNNDINTTKFITDNDDNTLNTIGQNSPLGIYTCTDQSLILFLDNDYNVNNINLIKLKSGNENTRMINMIFELYNYKSDVNLKKPILKSKNIISGSNNYYFNPNNNAVSLQGEYDEIETDYYEKRYSFTDTKITDIQSIVLKNNSQKKNTLTLLNNTINHTYYSDVQELIKRFDFSDISNYNKGYAEDLNNYIPTIVGDHIIAETKQTITSFYNKGPTYLNSSLEIIGDISANDASFNNVEIRGKINVSDLTVDGSLNVNDIIYNTIGHNVIISTSIDISNSGTGPAIKVSQTGMGDSNDVAIFDAGSEGISLKIDSIGKSIFYKNVEIIGDISANDASFNNVSIRDISANDASFNNVSMKDISANDASFNNVDVGNAIIGTDTENNVGVAYFGNNLVQTNLLSSFAVKQTSQGATTINSHNRPIRFKISDVDKMALYSNLLAIGVDISANDASFNNVDIRGDISMNVINTSIVNASKIDISSAFICLDARREGDMAQGGCMIQLQKSHLTGTTPDPAWRFGTSGSAGIENHFIIEPNNVTQGSLFNLDNNGTLQIGNAEFAPGFIDSGNSAFFGLKGTNVSGTKGWAIISDPNRTFVNALTTLLFRIGGISTKMYMNSSGVFLNNNSPVTSDDRLKHNEEDINGLSIIRQLNPKKYIKTEKPIRDDDGNILENYIDEDISGNIEVGLIAQELLETDISFVVKHPIPPAEGDDSDIIPDFQPYFVDYGSIMPYCIQAIKELDEKQTNQYNEIIELKSKVNDLQAENEILRNQT